LQVSLFKADYGKVRDERCVESGCADDYVDFVALSFVVDAAVCIEGSYASFDYPNVLLLKGLKSVSGSRLAGEFGLP
jgi:hypothetical protein